MSLFEQDLIKYLRPFWRAKTIENETMAFVGDEAGVLLFEPTKILSVKDYYLQNEYVLGEDYRVSERFFYRISDKIKYWRESEYYLDYFDVYKIGAKKQICARFGKQKYLKFGEGNTFTDRQIAISYEHSDEWDGPIPRAKSDKFVRALQKIKSGKPCKLLFYGDSITVGCNASGTEFGGMTPPYMPPYSGLVCKYLSGAFSANIQTVNAAKGGTNARWGLDNLNERVIAHAPDLLFLAFGMNDAATPIEQYGATIREIIEKTHSALPQTEIMLVSPILPNTEADEERFGNQVFFHLELAKIESEYAFVGLADVTEMHEHILKRGKKYRDTTANNVNHPNDFLHRLYAQVILATLLGNEFSL